MAGTAHPVENAQRIAVVGAGVSGLVTAHLLSRRHQVTVFEKGHYLGGHTNTIDVHDAATQQNLAVDTGFIVFNDRNYPNFCRLMKQLGVDSRASDMSFSVACEKTGLEYNGTNFNKLFAQRKNLVNPAFLLMLRQIARFNQNAKKLAQAPASASDDDQPLSAFLAAGRYSQAMIDRYLIPMGAAIWSTDTRTFLDFPAKFLAEFLDNHGMLDLNNRPQWRTVRGGSREYVKKLVAQTNADFRTQATVQSVRRNDADVAITVNGETQIFDHVVLACHSDQALALLQDPSHDETAALSAVGYQPNTAVLHTDDRMMPKTPLAWAAWNYRLPATPAARVTVTYNMNILQGLPTPTQYLVSLNPEKDQIDPGKILRAIEYHHPLYTTQRIEAHRRFDRINHTRRTSFCGAYWGHGFHEDGVKSGLRVCEAFGESL